MKKLLALYDAVASKLTAIPIDKYLHFIAGLLIAAFANYVMGWGACIAPVVVAAIAKEVVDEIRYGGADLADFGFTVAGGAVIQLLCLF